MGAGVIVPPFPALPAALNANRVRALLSADQQVDPFVRPWDVSALPHDLAAELWDWLDDVVVWLNGAHAWQPDQIVPVCWIQHPPLVMDLVTLALARVDAWDALVVIRAEDWHLRNLPAFYTRMNTGLGSDGVSCRAGRHQPRRTERQVEMFTDPGLRAAHREAVAADIDARRARPSA